MLAVENVALKEPLVPVEVESGAPLMVMVIGSPAGMKFVPLPIVPAKLIEAVPAVMDCEGVSALNVEAIPWTVSVPMDRSCCVPTTVVDVSVKEPIEELGLSNPIVKFWLALMVPKAQLKI